jgi:hypothetical protein
MFLRRKSDAQPSNLTEEQIRCSPKNATSEREKEEYLASVHRFSKRNTDWTRGTLKSIEYTKA